MPPFILIFADDHCDGLPITRYRDRLVTPFNDINELTEFRFYFGQGQDFYVTLPRR